MLGRFLRNNGLSIAFWALFPLCLAGTVWSGWRLQFEHPRGSGPPATPLGYLTTGDLWRGVLGNWQAALLQLFALIVFAVFLRQRGASHSRQPAYDGIPDRQDRPPGTVRRTASWMYRNSLSMAFLALFAASFAGFAATDWSVYNGERARLGEAAMPLGAFLGSARFWFDICQTWQAEFFAMGLFLLLTIFLRQDDSAESKPVWADDDDTGDTNE